MSVSPQSFADKATQMFGLIEDTKRLERELRALIGE
jgi:hypothetical protein